MCGRFNVLSSAQAFVDLLEVLVEMEAGPETGPRYNVAPSTEVLALRREATAEPARMEGLRWGLIPFWSKDPGLGTRMINARSETLAQRPAFRVPLRRRRCLIAADGWYEWRRQGRGREPYVIRRRDGAPFWFAGLWDRWRGRDAQGRALELQSCTILTAPAPAALAPIHPRMPLALDRGLYERWLDPELSEPAQLMAILAERPLEVFEARPVSRHVNDPRHEGPACLEPVADSGVDEGARVEPGAASRC